MNGHILISPLEHKSYLPTDKGTYEEIGVVIDAADGITEKREWNGKEYPPELSKGDKVYFDSWLASKFPTGEGDEYFWLVPFKDVKAVEKQNGTDTVSK